MHGIGITLPLAYWNSKNRILSPKYRIMFKVGTSNMSLSYVFIPVIFG
jgi:hypothetical protein